MKTSIFTFLLLIESFVVISQPASFSWDNRHRGYIQGHLYFKNYISEAKNQREQGPCSIFASVAGVEAMAQIYYNQTISSYTLNLSESELYSSCDTGDCVHPASAVQSLTYFTNTGVVNDGCLEYPIYKIGPCRFRDSCTRCASPNYKVQIPGFEDITPTNNLMVKQNLMEYGPIIVFFDDTGIGTVLHGVSLKHAVLLIGWESDDSWIIKDSWPNAQDTYAKDFDIFLYNPMFYRILKDDDFTCQGSDCSFFNKVCEDHDQDGYYNWGIGEKPDYGGPSKMDYNDNCADTISLNQYTPQLAPKISPNDPDFVCSSEDQFHLLNKPSECSVVWSVSPSAYFNSPTSGTTSTATVYPKSSELMKLCTITFTISEESSGWSKQFSKNFVINGPNPNELTVTVEDSYGHSPPCYSGVWLLCPHQTYYIYLNNSGNCQTYDYQWTLPAAWTKYSQYNNYVSIYTNNQAWGSVDIYAKTCCYASQGDRIKIKTQNFSQGYCGSYFIVYPNPSTDRITILFDEDFDFGHSNKTFEIIDIDNNIRYQNKDFDKENTIETTNWKDGIYFARLKIDGKIFTERFTIKH